MGKIVFWLIVFFVALLVLRLVNVANSRSAKGNKRGGRANAKDTAMIRCVNCGVYLPRADAIDGARGPVCGDAQCVARESGRR